MKKALRQKPSRYINREMVNAKNFLDSGAALGAINGEFSVRVDYITQRKGGGL